MKKKPEKSPNQVMLEDEVPRAWPDEAANRPKWRFDYSGEAPIPRVMLVSVYPRTKRSRYVELWDVGKDDKYWRNYVEFTLDKDDFNAWHADAERAIGIIQAADLANIDEIKEAYRGLCIAMTTAACLNTMEMPYQSVKDEVTDAAYSELF